MTKPINDKDYENLELLLNSENENLKFLGLNIVAILSKFMTGEKTEKYILKFFSCAFEIVKCSDINHPLFMPAMFMWKKLALNTEYKGKSITVEERTASNKVLEAVKKISFHLIKNVEKLFESAFEPLATNYSLDKRITILRHSLEAVSSIMDIFPTSLKNVISKKQTQENDKFTVFLIQSVQKYSQHVDLCTSILKILSKMFIVKDKRQESWKIQLTSIIDSINAFWALSRPTNLNVQQTTNLDTLYTDCVFYKFVDISFKVNLSSALRTMKMLFALLKMTLNEQQNEPYFIYGEISFGEILECLEGILTQQPFVPGSSITSSHIGLSALEFNLLCTHCKIDALETLRVLIYSYNLTDNIPWLRRCFEHLFKSEEILESHNLMQEAMLTLQYAVEKFKFGFYKITFNILLRDPDILHHILVLLKSVILRSDKSMIEVEDTKLKAGLKIHEKAKDLSKMYVTYTTERLNSKLFSYLKLLYCSIKSGIVSMCTRKERSTIDTHVYTFLQLSHIKFSPLPTEIQVLLLDIAAGLVLNSSYTTHNFHIMSALLHFMEMAKSGELNIELTSKITEIHQKVGKFIIFQIFLNMCLFA